MSKANPTRPDAPAEESSLREGGNLAEADGPPLRDPRSRSAADNIGVDEQGDLLDPELDDRPGDRGKGGGSFADDVRSDGDSVEQEPQD